MKRDPYLEKYIRLLEQNQARSLKDLERERKRVDFLEGKVERLELVVLESKSDAGREYVDRTDRAVESRRRPPITRGRVDAPLPEPSFADVRRRWDQMSAAEQQEAIDKKNLEVTEVKERTA